MVQVVRLINHFLWFPGDTETELSTNSRGCSAHSNLLPSIKEKYSVLPGPAGVMKGSPRPSQKSDWCRTRTKKVPSTNKTLGLEPVGAVQGEFRHEVSRDPSSSPITKPHGVERGQDQEDPGRGQDSRMWGPAHTPGARELSERHHPTPPRPAPNMKQLQGGGFSSTRDARPRRQALCEPGPGCQ